MRLISVLIILVASAASNAQTTYLGVYLKGSKIGYASYESTKSLYHNQSARKNISRTELNAGLLGTAMTIKMNSTTWTNLRGEPLHMVFDTESGGRSDIVDATFGSKSVFLRIENGGVKSTKTLKLPTDAKIIDDPLGPVIGGGLRIGPPRIYYILDSDTASLIKNEVRVIGPAKANVRGRQVNAVLVQIKDPRSPLNVFVNKRGDLVRVDAPAGIYMLPVSKTVALKIDTSYKPSTDLALSTSIKTDKPIDDPDDLRRLKLKISGNDLSKAPSDDFQSVAKDGSSWIVDVHPPQLSRESAAAIAQVSSEQIEWRKPSLNIPSDSPRFMRLAHSIIGNARDVKSASFAIQKYVYDSMKPNAGIGVLRDATEILDTKVGVCRDYATLTVTLLRSAGIPARLASGLVNFEGRFYYHAWAEAWDGYHWIGVDSTTDRAQISASHVKLSDGNVETAFTFTFLDQAKIEVLDAQT